LVLGFIVGRYADVANRSLELYQGMRVVMLVCWERLAVGAEVGVMTHGAFVTNTLDILQDIPVLAERAIAVDTVVAGARAPGLGQGLINGHEAVSRVGRLDVNDAFSTVIPIGAVQALVACPIDELFAAIANSGMTHVPTSVAEDTCKSGKNSLRGGGLEGMARMMTVIVKNVALHAEVIVVACDASDAILDRKDFNATVASHELINNGLLYGRLLLFHKSTRHALFSQRLRSLWHGHTNRFGL